MTKLRSIVGALASTVALVGLIAVAPGIASAAPLPHSKTQESPNITKGGGCNGNWYSYNIVIPAFGGGSALTDQEWSNANTELAASVGSFPSQYEGELYGDGFSGTDDNLTGWTTLWYPNSMYDFWHNSGSGRYVRAGFASCVCVAAAIQLIGYWTPNTTNC
ncbi:MAG: hypothetical protein ACP5QO_03595 [Clostridia bacterium]